MAAAALVLTAGAMAADPGYFSWMKPWGEFHTQARREVESQIAAAFKNEIAPGQLQFWVVYSTAWVGRLASDALLYALLAAWLSSRWVLKISSRRVSPRFLFSFAAWRPPEVCIFGLLAGAMGKLLLPPGLFWTWLAENLLVFFLSLYLLQSFALLLFGLRRRGWPSWAVGVFLFGGVLTALQAVAQAPKVVFLLAAPGVLDVWFHFREKMNRKKEEEIG